MNSNNLKTLNSNEWRDFFAQHDLTWQSVGTEWEQGAFLGNGTLGAMIYRKSDNVLRWELGCCEVVERFQIPNVDWAPPRLLIGDFLLETKGNIQNADMRLDLWNAEARGTVTTDCGDIKWRSVVHAEDMAIFIEVESTGDETEASLIFEPKHGVSPCLHYENIKRKVDSEWLEEHTPDKPAYIEEDGFHFSSQDYLAGGQYSVCWKKDSAHNTKRIYANISSTYPLRKAKEKAKKQLTKALSCKLENWLTKHRNWWHSYYSKSFVSLSDPYWESLYWIQIYKLGSATREDSPIIDSQGPWLTQTPWPTCVWNLNVQTSYAPLYTSNRFEIGESLYRALDKNLPDLIMNVPDSFRSDSAGIGRSSSCVTLESRTSPGWETGNLTWVCFNYYRHYRCTMDSELLEKRLYPLLRRAVNYYFHMTEDGDDGRIHLLYSVSPEYGPNKYTRDSNYDLALFEWGCRTLLEITKRLGIEDSRKKDWEDVISRLAEPPADENGLRIGRDLAYDHSHRHFSHLFSVWPLRTQNVDHPEFNALANRSINHWLSLDEELQGYTWTSSASMAASYEQGDLALERLNELRPFLQPNTMYMENGPVIETPISAAESIHDMLLQSWTDPQAEEHMFSVIRVFPAVPTDWKDVMFHQFRAEGSFLVSACRKNGETQWINIESLAGEPCILQADFSTPPETNYKSGIEWIGNNRWRIPLKKGESALIYPTGKMPAPEIRAIEHDSQYSNLFGMANKSNLVRSGKPAH